ncbi:MAG: phytoene desaturase [Bacteroidales bacterium]|nr:phytoene desaturase [Bacteroidales bacterium]
MTKNKSAVIIGAGVGGIATSIFLAKAGYKVSVYEKNNMPGGRCGRIVREGHRFDLGATIFLMPNIYKEVFAKLGFKIEECFETVQLETLYTLYFSDGTRLAFSSNLNKMQEQLEKLEKGSFNKMLFYLAGGYKKYRLAITRLIGRNFFHLFEFVTPANMLLLLKLKTFVRHKRYAARFFRHPHLQKAFTFQNIYVGQNPERVPALFSMIPAAEMTEGSFSAKGGMGIVVDKLLAGAEALGVKFFYGNAVEKIETVNKSAIGIVLKEGKLIEADIVVANADLPYVYRELLPGFKLSQKLEKKKYSCSAIVFHWGIKKVYPQIGHHSVFISEKYKENLQLVFDKKTLSDEPSFYIHAPVRSDKTAAPEGEDTLTVIVPSGHLDEKYEQDWNMLKSNARKSIIERLVKIGMADIEENIKFEICYLPATWQNMFNLTRGATFGSLGHNIMQMGYFRPHNRHSKYKNLYFTGGSTHPGNGIPLVLYSALLTSERILKESRNVLI